MPQTAAAHVNKSTNGRSMGPPVLLRSALAAVELVAPPLAVRLARSLYFRPQRLKVKPVEREVLERGTRFEVSDEGRRVVGRSWGQGPVVVLVHGWSGNLGQMTPFVGPLVEAGYHVVGFDWPGHGESEGEISSLLHVGRALLEVEKLFGGVHGVVAHSFGAAGTVFAMHRGLAPKRVVLHAPAARLETYVDRFSTAFHMSSAQRERFVRACEAWLKAPFTDFEPLRLAPSLKAPALMLHSDDDQEVVVAEATALAAAWPGSTFRLKDNLGHRRLLKDEQCIAETVKYLRESVL